MANDKFFWISKDSVFGFGKNSKKYGDEIDTDSIEEKQLKKLIDEKKIGKMLIPVDNTTPSEIVNLKEQLAGAKKMYADKIAELEDSHKKEVAKLKKEITKLKKGDKE